MCTRRELRRGLIGLVSLATAGVLVGCAATVSGQGSLAAEVRTPTADGPATDDPGDNSTGGPTGGPSDGPSDDSTGGGADASSVCSVVSGDELQRIFGARVTAKNKGDTSACDYSTTAGSIWVSRYDFLTLAEEKGSERGGTDLTIAGNPAYQVQDKRIMVARSKDPSARGLIVLSNLYFDDKQKGVTIGIALLNKIVPAFPM